MQAARQSGIVRERAAWLPICLLSQTVILTKRSGGELPQRKQAHEMTQQACASWPDMGLQAASGLRVLLVKVPVWRAHEIIDGISDARRYATLRYATPASKPSCVIRNKAGNKE